MTKVVYVFPLFPEFCKEEFILTYRNVRAAKTSLIRQSSLFNDLPPKGESQLHSFFGSDPKSESIKNPSLKERTKLRQKRKHGFIFLFNTIY